MHNSKYQSRTAVRCTYNVPTIISYLLNKSHTKKQLFLNQQTKELISTWKMSHKHNKDLSSSSPSCSASHTKKPVFNQ